MIAYSFHGEVSYARGLELQAAAFARGGGEIIGLTHSPVMTLGRHADARNLLSPPAHVEIVQVDRGGDVTYHGPEQVLLYPIVRVESVKVFATQIELAMIGYLHTLGLDGRREEGAPGVFVGAEKIGFLGLRVKEHISTHGLSLNLGGSLEPFSWMNPCGFKSLAVTNVERLTGRRPSHQEAASGLAQQLMRLLQAPPTVRSL